MHMIKVLYSQKHLRGTALLLGEDDRHHSHGIWHACILASSLLADWMSLGVVDNLEAHDIALLNWDWLISAECHGRNSLSETVSNTAHHETRKKELTYVC